MVRQIRKFLRKLDSDSSWNGYALDKKRFQVDFHPSLPLLAISANQYIYLWNYTNEHDRGPLVMEAKSHVEQLTFSACGTYFVTTLERSIAPLVTPVPPIHLQSKSPTTDAVLEDLDVSSAMGHKHSLLQQLSSTQSMDITCHWTGNPNERILRTTDALVTTEGVATVTQIVNTNSGISARRWENSEDGTLQPQLALRPQTTSLTLLPSWPHADTIQPDIILPVHKDDNLRIVLNQKSEDWNNLSTVIASHGSISTWKKFKSTTYNLNFSGFFLALKGYPAHYHPYVKVSTTIPSTELTRLDLRRPSDTWVFTPNRVWTQDSSGVEIQSRTSPRAAVDGHDRGSKWDQLHLAYFFGYADWNYAGYPFIFAEPSFETHEIEEHFERGFVNSKGEPESWRVLEAVFPANYAAHTRKQRFYFDREKLWIRRMEYVTDVSHGRERDCCSNVEGVVGKDPVTGVAMEVMAVDIPERHNAGVKWKVEAHQTYFNGSGVEVIG
ncbi:hypothetical protein BDZ45DRAFT_731885 [Acephala macrosclerotiorum]|nr:hypothetical protein BDZ45DRAFT_731885 [Acephala macrosclerotiorum]